MTLGCALALSAVVTLAALAGVDAELEIRAESRATTLAPSDVPAVGRGGFSVSPRALLRADASPVRLEARYRARAWTSDVEARPSPILEQEAELRIGTYTSRAWRADAAASLARGSTDPFADAWRALDTEGPSRVAALDPVPYEALRARLGASRSWDRRNTVGTELDAFRAGGRSAEDRAAYPLQRGASAALSWEHLSTPLDTLTLRSRTTATVTDAPDGERDATWTSAEGVWRRQLTRTVAGRIGGGAALSYEDGAGEEPIRGFLPVAEGAMTYARDGASFELAVFLKPYVDQYDGSVEPMGLASLGAGVRASRRVSLGARAYAGALPGGETAHAALDATVRYAARERLNLELGALARWQREARPETPSFFEVGVVAAATWGSGPL